MEVGVDALEFIVEQFELSFIRDLPDLSSPGSCMTIHGFVTTNCRRFALNLTTTKEPDSDIAFHINPRLSQRYVGRNSRINDVWGEEETTSISKFGFERGKSFVLDVIAAEREFFVSLDGSHICGFVFRIPISKVKVLQVEGGVEVQNIEYSKVRTYPQPSPENVPFKVPTGDGRSADVVQRLEMPLTAVLPRGFQQGWQLEIYGQVKLIPHAFYINLQEGGQLWPHPNVPLHLNPRFHSKHGKHLFVRNAWRDGHWGAEERATGFQFSPGNPFSLAIRMDEDHFSVWVDNQLSGEFKFRSDVKKIDTVYIHGDIFINSLYMRERISN